MNRSKSKRRIHKEKVAVDAGCDEGTKEHTFRLC